jgi:hypothetical protein
MLEAVFAPLLAEARAEASGEADAAPSEGAG